MMAGSLVHVTDVDLGKLAKFFSPTRRASQHQDFSKLQQPCQLGLQLVVPTLTEQRFWFRLHQLVKHLEKL